MDHRTPRDRSLLFNRRQALLAGAAVGSALVVPRFARDAWAASVPYEYACDKNGGFLPDPNEHKRVGYITDLAGLTTAGPLAKDLMIAFPWNVGSPTYGSFAGATPSGGLVKASVVGVLEAFSWSGGVGDAIKLDFWVSQQNAAALKVTQQAVTTKPTISSLGWWIINWDATSKSWYEQAFPQTPATVKASASTLNVDLTPTALKAGISVPIYKVSLVVAAAAPAALRFANDPKSPQTTAWGLTVGTIAPISTK